MAHPPRGHPAVALLVAALLALTGCAADRGSGNPVGTAVPALPSVAAPPQASGSYPFLAADHDATPIDLAGSGYTEREYLVSGSATVYAWPDLHTLTERATGPYTTRILVRAPADPARFSGSVRVEPLNPTSGHDLDAEWEIAHAGLMRAGDAYVGITVSPDTIRALRHFDPARYGALSMASPLPPDQRCDLGYGSRDDESGLAWDIISQVGRLLKTDSPANPLQRLHPRISVLTGWSQSGSLDLTYLDAVAGHVRLPGGGPVYDGYLPGAGSYAGNPISRCAPLPPAGDPRTRYDPPSGATPVIVVTTPSDFYTAASFDRPGDRPADSDSAGRRIRLYEVGGGSHLPGDQGWYFPDAAELARAGFAPEDRTTYPLSSFPLHVVLDAAFADLDSWISHGTPPPHAARLTPARPPDGPGGWPVLPALDRFGNPLGGVRTTAVDVPTATYTPHGWNAPRSDDGDYAGYDIPFSPGYLATLYPTHDDYVRKVSDDARRLTADRWLTPADADLLIAQARAAPVPGP
jgi:hypothetical protein